MWGESTYNFTRDQIGYHNGTPWTIVVRREDEPLLLGGPRGRTSISSSEYYIRGLVWWARLRFSRRSQKAWRVIVFKGFPTPSVVVGDALPFGGEQLHHVVALTAHAAPFLPTYVTVTYASVAY